MRSLTVGLIGTFALALVAAAPAFAAHHSNGASGSNGSGGALANNGPLVAKVWMTSDSSGKGTGPARWHSKNSNTLLGVHGRHLSQGQSVSAAAFGGANCSGSAVGKAGPKQVNQKGHVVLKINAGQQPDAIQSAGIEDSSGKVLSCANHKK